MCVHVRPAIRCEIQMRVGMMRDYWLVDFRRKTANPAHASSGPKHLCFGGVGSRAEPPRNPAHLSAGALWGEMPGFQRAPDVGYASPRRKRYRISGVYLASRDIASQKRKFIIRILRKRQTNVRYWEVKTEVLE